MACVYWNKWVFLSQSVPDRPDGVSARLNVLSLAVSVSVGVPKRKVGTGSSHTSSHNQGYALKDSLASYNWLVSAHRRAMCCPAAARGFVVCRMLMFKQVVAATAAIVGLLAPLPAGASMVPFPSFTETFTQSGLTDGKTRYKAFIDRAILRGVNSAAQHIPGSSDCFYKYVHFGQVGPPLLPLRNGSSEYISTAVLPPSYDPLTSIIASSTSNVNIFLFLGPYFSHYNTHAASLGAV